jgi:nucleoside-diphosphate-sugar epimerase
MSRGKEELVVGRAVKERHGKTMRRTRQHKPALCFARSVFLLAVTLACLNFFLLPQCAQSLAVPTTTSSVITGASGYVGRAVAHALVETNEKEHSESINNNRVLCLVRASRVEQEQKYWRNKLCVTVLPYDMLDGGSTLRAALEFGNQTSDCSICVYHIASWFSPTEEHVQAAKNNVKGTQDLVRALAEFKNTKLVITSSMAAVRATGQEPQNGQYYTESDWNTVSKLGDNWGASYQWSKQESERQAWELTKELKIPMVSLCPSFVFGPPACDENTAATTSNSFSTELVATWILGSSQVQSRLFVDLRDVAQAHVAAGILPDAVGQRFLLTTERRLASAKVASLLREKCKEHHYVPPQPITHDAEFSGGAIPIGQKEVEAEERLLKSLGVSLRPAEETIDDMGKFFIRMFQRDTSTV